MLKVFSTKKLWRAILPPPNTPTSSVSLSSHGAILLKTFEG